MKKIQSIIYFLLFVSLPFERVLTFDFLEFTLKLPYIFAIIAIGYFFLVSIKDKSLQRPDKVEKVLALFIGWSFLSVVWSVDKEKTLIVSSMFLLMGLLFFVIRRTLSEAKDFYFQLFIYLGVFASIFALWQFFGDSFGLSSKLTLLGPAYTKALFGFPRVQSTFFEPGFFANFLLIPIFALVNRFSIGANDRKSVVFFVVMLLAFFLTLSRGGIISLAAGLLLFCLFILIYKRSRAVSLAKPVLLMFFAFLLAILCVFAVAKGIGVKAYLHQTINSEDMAQYKEGDSDRLMVRSYTIRVALENWRQHPILGVGTGAFGALPEFARIRTEGNMRQTVNSLYPEILVEEGVVGLVLFFIFIAMVIWLILKEQGLDSTDKIIFTVAVIALFLQFASLSTVYQTYIWVFLGLILPYRQRTEGSISGGKN